MGIGTDDGKYFDSHLEYLLNTARGASDKKFADSKEMASNELSGDFESRYSAAETAPRMPLGATEKLAGALKSSGRSQLAIDDRRDVEPFSRQAFDDSMSNIGTTLMNTIRGGTPRLVEAPVSNLSRQLGHEDIKIEPNVGHPPIEDLGRAGLPFIKDIGIDVNTPFEKGTKIGNKLFGTGEEERYQTWPERLARSAFTLPGDVLSGKVKPGSIQEIERAADLAGLVVGGPAPVAAKLADGTLGSFAGVKSKTLPKDKLYEAQSMELDATHPDTIYEKTGFFRGADQRWRYEIPDQNLKLNYGRLQGDNEVSVFPPTKNVFGEKIKGNSLSEIIDHPELFKAYPHLSKIKIEPMPEGVNSLGMKMDNTIYMNKMHSELFKDVLMHEVQHVIQDHEGFAKGGTVEQFVKEGATADEKRAYSEAFEKYSRLMGEVEARNVESRLRYKTYEREVLPPYRTEDTFRSQQINNK